MKFINGFIYYLKKHKKRVITGIIILAIIAFIFRPKPPAPIPTQEIKSGDIQQVVSATGSIVAKTSINLVFQIPGLVTYVSVKKGDFVNAYQTIAAIDARTAQKNLQSALIDYSKQRIAFDQTLDNNHVKSAQDALNDDMKRILQDNQYDLDKAVVSVELQDLAKQKSVLTTPISGIVSRADIETPGVVATATSTYTIVDPDSLVFSMDVDEADISKIIIGQNVGVTLDSFPEKTIDLTISSIDFVSHNTSTGGTAFTVEATLPSSENNNYRIGMSGNGDILIQQKRDVVTVPLVSIFNKDHVYVKTKSGFADRRLQLGLQNDTDSEVIEGLKTGEYVALQPNLVPKPSSKK